MKSLTFTIWAAGAAIVFATSVTILRASEGPQLSSELQSPTSKFLEMSTGLADPNLFRAADLDGFLKLDAEGGDLVQDPFAHLQVVNSYSLRKIQYGELSTVRIVTTSHGTYSTDGLNNSSIIYFGYDVNGQARK